MPRVVVVAAAPTRAACSLYRALAADGRIELHVLIGAMPEPPLLDGYAHGPLPARLGPRLDALGPDVVHIRGLFSASSLQAILWARTRWRRLLATDEREPLTAARRLALPWLRRLVDEMVDDGISADDFIGAVDRVLMR